MEEKADCRNWDSISVSEQLMEHIRNGIYKEMHRRGILTDAQLNSLLNGKC